MGPWFVADAPSPAPAVRRFLVGQEGCESKGCVLFIWGIVLWDAVDTDAWWVSGMLEEWSACPGNAL